MSSESTSEPIEILLIEDNPADARLTREGLKEARIVNSLHVARNGEEAIKFLHRRDGYAHKPRPDLILLDLNLPGMDGRTVLETIKDDRNLRSIPVVVLTSSEAETDILKSYEACANCYVAKPIEFGSFLGVVGSIEQFWFSVVKLPQYDGTSRGSA